MQPFPSGARAWTAEARATLVLAWPIALTNLSQIALTVTDTALLGRLSTEALAAVTLGSALWWAALAPGFGVAFAAAAVLAQERGAGGRGVIRRMRRSLRAALHLALLACIPPALLCWHAGPVLVALGQDPALAALAQSYLRAMVWGMPCFFGFLVLRSFLSALERPRPALLVVLGAVALNAALGWLLIFGEYGAPALGAVGAGVAAAVSDLFMLVGLGLVCAWHPRFRRYRVFGRLWRPDVPRLWEMLRLGLPIAGTMVLEIGMFSAVGLLMGRFGTGAVAAHAVALQVASATFMVPLGIGQAATARVGLAAGAGQPAAAQRSGWTAIALAASFALVCAAALVLFPAAVVAVFLDPRAPGAADTMALAATLLAVAGAFQLADGVQTAAGGALRGLKDTRVPMWLAACGYWVLGLPAAWLLSGPLNGGPLGVWAGLAAGIALVSVLLTWRWARLSKGFAPAALPAGRVA
ncbi:MATE family efflux transporter [Roseomonas sp. BN140053]|uniref:MATE family efflux transporter n=1 Tax=Roseomonas sp. BN140053 TaxID=3391898 RepID=UPI0039ECA12E